METFSALLAICAGIHRSPVNSPHTGQWRIALMFSLICASINGWVNIREVGDLRRHCAHYDVTVMILGCIQIHIDIYPLLDSEGPFYQHRLPEITSKINNYIRCVLWAVITYPWHNFSLGLASCSWRQGIDEELYVMMREITDPQPSLGWHISRYILPFNGCSHTSQTWSLRYFPLFETFIYPHIHWYLSRYRWVCGAKWSYLKQV